MVWPSPPSSVENYTDVFFLMKPSLRVEGSSVAIMEKDLSQIPIDNKTRDLLIAVLALAERNADLGRE